MADPWQQGTDWTPPDRTTIDVWLVDLTIRKGDAELLVEEERARAAQFIVEAPRRQYIAARAALRRILGRSVSTVSITYEEHGKPVLADHDTPVFNVSHSEDHALIAVCAEPVLGVDIEHCRDFRNFEGLAKRFFAKAEADAFMAQPETERLAAFYRAWTFKEAYLKAWGTGLSFPSRRFSIDYLSDAAVRLVLTSMPGDHDTETWQFRDLPVPPGYAGAICWQHGDRSLRLWRYA